MNLKNIRKYFVKKLLDLIFREERAIEKKLEERGALIEKHSAELQAEIAQSEAVLKEHESGAWQERVAQEESKGKTKH